MRTIHYNRRAAIQYAEQWALSRNPEYYNFDLLGGDCTNFISQCVYAGAGIMNYTPDVGWYYLSLNNRSAAWTSVQAFYRFIISNNGPGPVAQISNRTQMQPGDVIQLGNRDGDFYHSLVMLKNSQNRMYVAAHTNDALWRPLESYTYAVARYLHIVGVNMT